MVGPAPIDASPVAGIRIAYLCLQATTPGQASYAHVHEIISGLRKQGAAVDLFEPSYAGKEAPGAIGRVLEFARVQRRVLDAMDRYDVLYVRGHALAWWASEGARRRGVTVVQECNGIVDDFFIAWPSARLFAPLIRWLTYTQFRRADAVIAGSSGLAEWLLRETGVVADIVPNGANTEIFNPDEEIPEGIVVPGRYAVFFGSFAPWQGISTSLEAVRRPEWPQDVSLLIVGQGTKRAEVEEAARTDSRVVYLGTLPYDQIAGVVAHALVSLVNKEADEFSEAGISPLKLYESMASGTPVIATDGMPGLTEVVRDNRAGLIVPQRDPEALARAVAQLAGSPGLAAELGANGRRYAEAECSWYARSEDTARIIARAR